MSSERADNEVCAGAESVFRGGCEMWCGQRLQQANRGVGHPSAGQPPTQPIKNVNEASPYHTLALNGVIQTTGIAICLLLQPAMDYGPEDT